ncbi:sensor histidine kinase [Solihabitans fulvus]|uniref:histidine kinase n=2 Tax=Solihabitans fulvus TaxID=1892852 RepID=A0A5B2XH94_9PSEU|nr:sensor histidine kinase [Solihabitans fulvus]
MAPYGTYQYSVPAAVVACLALPLRLRWPWLGVLLCLPALTGGLGWPATIVAQYRVGRTSRSTVTVACWVVAVTAAAVLPVIISQHMIWTSAVLTVLFSLLMAGAPAAVGTLVRVRQELTASLAEVRRAREGELAALEDSARAAERARIAREIHDAVGHHTTLIAVESAALAATTAEERTKETAQRLRALAKESLAEMRAALGILTGPRRQAQGVSDLPALVERARAAGLAVRLTDRTPVGADLTPAIDRAVYRVVQEALTNVTKHAPGAAVRVCLEHQGGRLTVSVVNDPSPQPGAPNPERGGAGLHGLSERVRMVGGSLHTEQSADGGFAVRAALPAGPSLPAATSLSLSGPMVPNPLRQSKVDGDDSTFGGSEPDIAHA